MRDINQNICVLYNRHTELIKNKINCLAAAAFVAMIAHPVSGQDVQDVDLSIYQRGLLADLYIIDASDEEGAQDTPPSFSMGQFVDDAPPIFKLNAHEQDSALADYGQTDSIAIRWKGYIKIESEGRYVFSQEAIFTATTWAWSCFAQSTLGDRLLFEGKYETRARGSYLKGIQTEQQALELSSGLYEFKMWIHCAQGAQLPVEESKISVVLKYRGPGDRTIKPIPSTVFFWR